MICRLMAEAAVTLNPIWPWTGREDVRDFCALLDGDAPAGSKARLVGGAVRDAILGVAASDIDIATPLKPDEVQTIAREAGIKSIPTGIDHGTVTILLASGPVEVTTLRRDVSTDGRHATIAFCDDWRQDAARRDFTFNALYAEPTTGQVHDYFAGIADLKAGKLRFIGDARRRIEEDYLRILRLFRFHARFGTVPIDSDIITLCNTMGPMLKSLSRERISGELLRLLMAQRALGAMHAMRDAQLWPHILPEMRENGLMLFEQLVTRAKQHDVETDPMTRLAALLPLQRDIMDQVAAHLRLSNVDRETLRRFAATAPEALDNPHALGFRLGNHAAIQSALLLGRDSACTAVIAALKDWKPPVFPITGRDIMAIGIAPGPQIGEALAALEDIWIAQGFQEISNNKAFIDAHRDTLPR